MRIKDCPTPTSVYTGCEGQIRQVGACISGGADERRVCVVHGLGGAGKTQLALKTIERNRDGWKHVLYLDASSKKSIECTLQDFANANGIGRSHEDTLTWLAGCRAPWLMVLNNADHPSLNIHKYFPSGIHGNILITTRLRSLTTHARGPGSVCHVSGMNHEDSLALLLKVARIQGDEITSNELEAADALLQVGGLVFAVPQRMNVRSCLCRTLVILRSQLYTPVHTSATHPTSIYQSICNYSSLNDNAC